ncbi:hypothetical protein DFH29DRAFT_621166 [Suillus ampliporus]|nr:hypothetical protein DFH29DRAFT_621166 [Suillus ampliporus]
MLPSVGDIHVSSDCILLFLAFDTMWPCCTSFPGTVLDAAGDIVQTLQFFVECTPRPLVWIDVFHTRQSEFFCLASIRGRLGNGLGSSWLILSNSLRAEALAMIQLSSQRRIKLAYIFVFFTGPMHFLFQRAEFDRMARSSLQTFLS